MLLAPLAFVAAAALALGWVINQIIAHFRHAARAKELGCLPAASGFNLDPSGIHSMIKGVQASRRKEFPPFVKEQFDLLSEAKGRVIGTSKLRAPFFRDIIITIDPQNIQAMLALKFKEFGFGVSRTENFAPLLGNGIVRHL